MTDSPTAERNAALLAWYREQRRDLPWRGTRDPYRILVAEVMSQQTQAERVAAHYESFVADFPDVVALAAARFSAVAAAWSGLGYNARARRLHLAAKQITATGWPTTYEDLLALPGVGPYTAAAVACFAFGEDRPAVDTNLRRVLSRWHGEALSGRTLQRVALRSLGQDAAQWNQAVMDLGATVCRPRNPGCAACPVASWCAGPEIYEPPPRQARFEGSVRQARGAVMRIVIAGPASLLELIAGTGLPAERITGAVTGLVDDGLIERTTDDRLTLVD